MRMLEIRVDSKEPPALERWKGDDIPSWDGKKFIFVEMDFPCGFPTSSLVSRSLDLFKNGARVRSVKFREMS